MKYTLTAPNGKVLISVESSPVDKPEKENKYILSDCTTQNTKIRILEQVSWHSVRE